MNDDVFVELQKRIEAISMPIVPPAPRKGERWDSVLQGKTARVMARFKGAAPFLVPVREWNQKFIRKPQ